MSAAGSSPGGIGPGTGVAGVQPVRPEKSSGCLKGCLIAAGVLVILLILVSALTGWLVCSKSSNWLSLAMEKGKPEVMRYLSPDVSPDDRAEFEKTYDDMVGTIKKEGFIKSVMEHKNSWETFRAITEDKKIDAEEISKWVSEWKKEAEQQGGKTQSP